MTEYPRHGTVRVHVVTGSDRPWSLTVRVPSWAAGATLAAPGEPARDVAPGTVTLTRAFAAGDVVELVLPIAARVTRPDPRIDAVRGCVAVERGPEVYCLESTDLPGGEVAGVRIDPASVVDVDGTVRARFGTADGTDAAWPYAADVPAASPAAVLEAVLVPYHDWANRGPSTMRVWIPAAD